MAKPTDMYNNKAYYQHIYASEEINSQQSRQFYHDVAEYLQRVLSVNSVLDVGCATGMVVSAFRDLGIEAYGIDVSAYAISQVQERDKPFVHEQSALEELPEDFPEHFDLVTCIEVAEHIPEEQTKAFIKRLCELGNYIVFSSSPSDMEDRTHFNVQQQEYWCKRFAENGFYRCMDREMMLPTTWTICFSRFQLEPPQIVEAYERRDRINQLIREKPQQYQAILLFDKGDGFDDSCTSVIPYQNGQYIESVLDLEGVRCLRVVPCTDQVCMVSDLRLNLRFRSISPIESNGIKVDNGYLFPTMDPFVDFNISDESTGQGKLSGRITLISESNDIACQLMGIKEQIDALEMERQHHQDQIRMEQAAFEEKLKGVMENFTRERQTLTDKCAQLEALQHQHEVEICQMQGQHEEYQKVGNAKYKSKIQELEVRVRRYKQELDEVEKQWIGCKKKIEQIAAERDAMYQAREAAIKERDAMCLAQQAAVTQRDVMYRECNEIRMNFDVAIQQRDGYRADLDRITTGFWWRVTAPGRFVSSRVKKLLFKEERALRGNDETVPQDDQKKLYVTEHVSQPQEIDPPSGPISLQSPAATDLVTSTEPARTSSVAELFRDTGNPVWPISTVIVDEKVKRLNLVTDTIESSSLLGGVATALIVATLFCVKNDYELRIVTRTAQPVPLNYENILHINNLPRPKKVSYYSDFTGVPGSIPNFKMEITEEDVFFATSWWSAESIRRTTLRKRFFYIIQEAETFFYNYGGERRMCEAIMQDPNIDFIINSGYLNEYFRLNEPNVWSNGVAFEPAFTEALYSAAQEDGKIAAKPDGNGKHRLLFYGRPHNPRNLFNYGVNILEKAIADGIIDTNEWEICFAGANVPPVTFCNGSQSVCMGQMTWTEYAEFLKSVDLALCLMYTPHPSYPPYDAACSGSVVVTNRYMTKREFPQCNNVIMADLTDEGLLEGLRAGVELALDDKKRSENYRQSTIPRRWEETLQSTLEFMQRKTL